VVGAFRRIEDLYSRTEDAGNLSRKDERISKFYFSTELRLQLLEATEDWRIALDKINQIENEVSNK